MRDDTLSPTADLSRLTATQARAGLKAGEFTALDLMRSCLKRIALRDKDVRAWITLNPEAEAQAALIRADDPRPLAGIPVAIKDMIDTGDLPTTHNSPLYSTNRPGSDAPCVEVLKAAGAIVIGKTDTTEFAACGRNAATANPFDVARTPGGSSAGTAAGVADFHVPLGLGTQTGGSTIRPASFCGDVALKPSWGLISTEGAKRYAVSFDTIGLFARSLDDIALLADVYNLPQAPDVPARRLKLGLCRTPYADQLAPEGRALMDSLAQRLHEVADVVPFDLPEDFVDLDALHRCIQHCEGASAFLNLARKRGALLHDDFHHRVDLREGFTQREHFEAYDRLTLMRMEFEQMLDGFDGVLAPSAPGFAPLGRSAGNPLFNALWTALQVPVLGLPASGFDLPLGVSLIGKRAFDRQVIAVGARIAAHL
ncbi:Glutamyl-tRNA(Gln) amidotransferase subunit A [Aquimixticola soesokkakensis]|uniref:Glutamyl-tRNA(Gln) amidotransferase subunit A n=1 Tax=Aquimixticola soesokkakensis TaxID=1519096 RepID=A0A1Y5T6H1_9RHOB|nr:amidase [Aquimixticola soesokkakensis]SLN56954.1 Glutamyl-tRNA(Gln) amidotransferase subunit A [Aquimixticola soesokkakensis]